MSSSGRPQRTTCLSTAATHALAFQESLVCGLIEDACVHFSGPRLPVDPSIEECYRSVARLCEHTAAHDHRWRKQALRRAVSRGACYRNRYFGTVDQPEEQTRASAFTTAPVAAIAAHVYDLRGVESSNDATLELGMGVFHVGVEVFGVEWSFGCVVGGDLITGIYPVRPKRCPIGRYRESIYLGEARAHDARRVWSLIESFTETWIGKEYHPLHKNCVHFCEELSARLGVDAIPAWVGRLADTADTLLSPFLAALGSQLLPPRNSGEDGLVDEQLPESRPGADQGRTASSLTASGPQVASPTSKLSPATQVALDFETRFGWALIVMLVVEAQLTVTVEAASDTGSDVSESV